MLTIEEEGPGVADDPTLEIETPACRDHEQTDKHDGSILDQAPAAADPVANKTDANLADHDADNFKIGDRGDPVVAALGAGLAPTLWPCGGKERLQVANAEQDVAFEAQTGTGQHGVAEVVGQGA